MLPPARTEVSPPSSGIRGLCLQSPGRSEVNGSVVLGKGKASLVLTRVAHSEATRGTQGLCKERLGEAAEPAALC